MAIFNEFGESLYRPALQYLSGRVLVNKPGLFLAHFVAPALSSAFPTFFGISPRPALLELLAMALVFTTYRDGFKSALGSEPRRVEKGNEGVYLADCRCEF